MNFELSPAPNHIAAPKIHFLGKFFIVIFILVGYGLLMDGDSIFRLILAQFIVFALICYRIFGFKKCPSCKRNYITKSKKYCYDCWLKARQSVITQDILNPED